MKGEKKKENKKGSDAPARKSRRTSRTSEIENLRSRIEELEEILRAIRSGEVDALVVSGAEGDRVYTLEGAEHTYRVIVETMSEGALTMDTDGTILYSNSVFSNLAKTPMEQIVGSSVYDFFDKGERIKISRRLKKIAKGGMRMETRVAAAGGASVPVYLSAVQLKTEEMHGFCVVVTDISQLLAAEQRSRMIIDTAQEGIGTIDTEGKVTFANKRMAEMLGYEVNEMPGMSVFDFVDDSDRADAAERLERRLKGDTEQFDFRLMKKNGSFMWAIISAGPIVDEKGGVIGSIGLITDITRRKKAEDEVRRLNAELEERVAQRTSQLQESYKELEAFSYSVSHDLRAPVRVIEGLASIVMEDFGGKLEREGKKLLETIHGNAKKMDQLIIGLLSLSQIGRRELQITAVNMNKIVKEAIDELKSGLPGVSPHFEIKALPPARADAVLVRQVFINLLANAVKFSEGKNPALIEIGGSGAGGENVYYVKDNGIGFEMKYAGKIYGVFQRLHGSKEFEGTGVGLSIVQRIIQRHGGRIWAESKPNEGATFYFTVPSGKHDDERGKKAGRQGGAGKLS